MGFLFGARPQAVTEANALPGREIAIFDPATFDHRIFGKALDVVPDGCEIGYFALGCFWGAEKLFWETDGVVNTGVGYMGGITPNPTYRETCTGLTGHAETVHVVFDPAVVSYRQLVELFFEQHDPTQVDRQGNDIGTQYRSALFTLTNEQDSTANLVRESFQDALAKAKYGQIATEIVPAGEFYWAEDYHQQYLDANPNGYCPVHATGVKCGPAS